MSFSVFTVPQPHVFFKLEQSQVKNLMMSQHFMDVIRVKESLNSLESHENKLQPKPGQSQHDDHVWEGKAEPGSKVDDISVLRKKSEKNSESLIGQE